MEEMRNQFEIKYNVNKMKDAKIDESISEFIGLLECVSINMLQNVFIHNKTILFMNYGMESSIDSLKSVLELCKNGNIIDSYVLLRKIRDNLFLDLFLLCDYVKNTAPETSNIDIFSKDKINIDFEKFMKYFVKRSEEIARYNSTDIEKNSISNWYDNKLSKSDKKDYFDFNKYIFNIKRLDERFNECYKKYLKTKLNDLSINFNNYVHSNGIVFLSNKNLGHPLNICNEFKKLRQCIEDLKKVFIISIYLIDPLKIMSSDYLDSLDYGEPCEEYKHYILGGALNVFKDIKQTEPDLFDYLEKENIYSLYLKEEDYI